MSDPAQPQTKKLPVLAGEVVRYVIVGGGTYVVDFLVYLLVVTLAPALYLQGNVAGRIAGAALGFVLHKYWTFGGNHTRSAPVQALSYAALLGFNIAFSSALLMGFHTYLPALGPVFSRIATDVIVIAFTFICSKHIFHKRPVDETAAAQALEAGSAKGIE